jgi:hypothetical protein
VVLPYFFGDVLPFLPELDSEIKTLLNFSMASGKDSYLSRSIVAWKNGDYDLTNPLSWNQLYNVSLSSSAGV